MNEKLAIQFQRTGDRSIERELVERNLPLISKLARAHRLPAHELPDLIQEGCIGFLRALRKWDRKRKVKLSTYAAWWIRAYQLRYLLHNHRIVKLGTTAAQRRIFFRLPNVRARLVAAGLDATPDALAEMLDADRDEIEETMRRMDSRDLSLDVPVHTGSDETRGERLSATAIRPDETRELAEVRAIFDTEVSRFRSELDARDRKLFDARFMGDQQPSLREIGVELSVSRERARQLEQRLVERLRKRVENSLHRGKLERAA
jgi:RNA polymerase sigma-32 factor